MERWLKIGGAVIIGIVALWVIIAIVRFVIGLVMTIIYFAAILTVLAVLIYLAYVLLSKIGGSDSSSERSRERIYE